MSATILDEEIKSQHSNRSLWRKMILASIITAVAQVAVGEILSSRMTSYQESVGPIISLIGLLVWVVYTCYVLILSEYINQLSPRLKIDRALIYVAGFSFATLILMKLLQSVLSGFVLLLSFEQHLFPILMITVIMVATANIRLNYLRKRKTGRAVLLLILVIVLMGMMA